MTIEVQHEFDHEPTYIVDKDRPNNPLPAPFNDPLVLVELSPRLKHNLRQMLVQRITKQIEDYAKSVEDAYYTDEEFDSLTAYGIGL